MKKILTLALAITGMLAAEKSFAAIYPTLNSCIGVPTTLYDSSSGGPSTGGTWSSSNTAIATIGATSGILTGVSAGTCIITYAGSTTTTAVYTVYPNPAAIVGAGSSFCVGSSVTLTNATSGGTWSSMYSYVATIGSATGLCTGAHAGTAVIRYSLGTGCYASATVTVTGTAADSLSGASSACVGSAITLTASASGGTWSSSAPSVATVSGTGVVTGVSVGTATISHTVTGSCGAYTSTHVVSIVSAITAGTIGGTTTLSAGSTSLLTSTVGGGTWSSSSTAVATVSAGGLVTGVTAGTAVITYTVAGCSGPVYATTTVTITTPNCISGDVLFTGAPLYGPVKVWLIKYNAATHILSAVDSAYVYASGASAHYSFCGMGTDSFRVKAADDSMVAGTGYLPTYHTSSAYWNTATVIYHVAGTNDINKHITMGYGTTTSGPGFIAGDVTTGANKGTAGIPAVGLLMYCVNNTTGQILQHTKTDNLGHYSFSSLPTGTPIKIYPELMNYATTPYPAITLTTASPSMTAASFIQHTLSLTITPVTSGLNNVTEANAGINVFPNPTSGTLNIKWNTTNAGNGSVVITDVTGRQVLTAAIDMTQAGSMPLSLTGISNGIYMISIQADGVNYNATIQVK